MAKIYGHKWGEKLGGTSVGDQIWGYNGNDILNGKDGNDRLWGGNGHDELAGGDGNDKLDGGTGNDKLRGLTGADRLYGQAGNDSLFGGDGDDYMVGGGGSDTFYFALSTWHDVGKDKIADFNPNFDYIHLGDFVEFDDLDTDHDGELTNNDWYVTRDGNTTRLDVGAAYGGDWGKQVLTVDSTSNQTLKEWDFMFN